MKRNHIRSTRAPTTAAFFAILVAVALLAVSAQGPAGAAEGDTNFTNVVTTGDITVGDDLDVTDDLGVTGNTTIAGTLGVSGAITGPAIGTENLRLPTIESSTVITSSNGAMWTVGATEVWWIDRVFCNITTNFDCTGDDCTIEIGLTGGDIDGFLDLDDAELQTTDAEIAGLTAGWQGFGSTDTRGAFFAAGGGVILSNDTIDIKIEDNSDQSNPTAGAATCYIVYTRLQ
jgi:hypothetical protein